MRPYITKLRRSALALTIGASLVLSGCKSESTPENQSGATLSPSTESAKTDVAPVPGLLAVNDQTWTPEAMEDLLAPVALYPDDILGEVLVAATNPQEVLDAGNWRLKNESLEGKALDDAAKAAGFTPPVRMVLQNPTALDMMCSEFGWTQELGQAFVNDQEGVLAAVQRLRRQAKDAGSLASSDKMVVDTETVGTEQAIVLSSPDPEVVYVPQYDPETAYAPAGETEDDDGISTGTAIAVAALAFGAGLALSQVFDDDDDDWYDDDYYYPNYYGPPMPYYSHYPYRPAYGGYYASTAYVRPANYRYAYNNTTVVRTGGANYWNRYDDRSYVRRDGRNYNSPITKARGNRPELQYLNEKAKRGPNRRAPNVAEERGRYQEKKRETATRAEQRGRGKGQRRVADVDRGGRDRAGKADRENRGRLDGAGGDSGGRDRDRTKPGGGGGRDDRLRQGGGGGDNKAGSGGRRGGGGKKASGGRSGGGGKKASGGRSGGGGKKASGGGGNKGGGGRRRG